MEGYKKNNIQHPRRHRIRQIRLNINEQLRVWYEFFTHSMMNIICICSLLMRICCCLWLIIICRIHAWYWILYLYTLIIKVSHGRGNEGLQGGKRWWSTLLDTPPHGGDRMVPQGQEGKKGIAFGLRRDGLLGHPIMNTPHPSIMVN